MGRKQKVLPGVLPPKVEKLDELAQDYEEIKNERCALSAKEREAKQKVETYMISNKISNYRVNANTSFFIEEEKHLKIMKSKSESEDDE